MTSNSSTGAMQYDVIIVGAGSAGATLASRVSEDPKLSVLLLEEGPDYRTLSETPEDVQRYQMESGRGIEARHKRDFPVRINSSQERIKFMHRGHVVGGTSAVNGAFFLRGLPEDFDEWAALGQLRVGLRQRAPLLPQNGERFRLRRRLPRQARPPTHPPPPPRVPPAQRTRPSTRPALPPATPTSRT